MPRYPRHYRVAILHKAAQILQRGPTIAGIRIYVQRYSPLGDDPGKTEAYLPAVILSTTHEDAVAIDNTQDRRTIDLVAECYVTDCDDLDNPLDVLTEQIDLLIRRDQTLEKTVEWIRYKSSDWIYDKESESLIEGARVTYEVRYIWDSWSTLPLDDFDELEVTTNVGDTSLSQIVEIDQS